MTPDLGAAFGLSCWCRRTELHSTEADDQQRSEWTTSTRWHPRESDNIPPDWLSLRRNSAEPWLTRRGYRRLVHPSIGSPHRAGCSPSPPLRRVTHEFQHAKPRVRADSLKTAQSAQWCDRVGAVGRRALRRTRNCPRDCVLRIGRGRVPELQCTRPARREMSASPVLPRTVHGARDSSD